MALTGGHGTTMALSRRRVLVCMAVCMAAAASGVECFSPAAGGSCMRLREDADARTTRLLAAKA
jgi:hypothetical protein